jgi:hypothetical protein
MGYIYELVLGADPNGFFNLIKTNLIFVTKINIFYDVMTSWHFSVDHKTNNASYQMRTE